MVGSNLGLTQQQAMFPDYCPFIQLGQEKRDDVNTGFPKESKGIQGAKKVMFTACNLGKLKLTLFY